MNKSGPRQDPCGIPHVINLSLDAWLPKEQYRFLFLKQAASQFPVMPLMPIAFNFTTIILWSTVSNASSNLETLTS